MAANREVLYHIEISAVNMDRLGGHIYFFSQQMQIFFKVQLYNTKLYQNHLSGFMVAS